MNDRRKQASARKRSRLEEVFGLDLRSLALFRISIATLLFGDLAFRLPHLLPLYAEHGLLGRQAALEVIGAGLYLSPHFWLRGSVVALGCLFAFQLLTALAMLVGYRTRFATALSWYLLASLQVVETYHFHLGGDTYLRMMLLWGALLPLGHRWSVDAQRQQSGTTPPPQPAKRAYSWVTVALVLQFLLFYVAAGLSKNTPMWNDGDALYYLLHRDHLATVFTPMLLEQRWALTPLTYGTYWFEVLGPLLLVFPFYTATVRMVGIAMFLLFHLGLATFLYIGPYPLMSIAPFAALLPSRFWEVWWPRVRGRAPRDRDEREEEEFDEGQARRESRSLGAPRIVQVFACLVIVYSLLYQLQDARLFTLPRPLVVAASALRLNQNYKMMQTIGTRNFWLIVDGHTSDGSRIDPFQGRPLSTEKPDDIPATLRGFRWAQFIMGSVANVATEGRSQILHHGFAEYLCREWNADHWGAERLERLSTIRGYETTHLDRVEPPQFVVLWQHECGASLEADLERDAAP